MVFKHLKSVPDVAESSIFGGQTREYQVQVDPNRLIAYGLTISQVEQALAQQQRERRAAALSKKASRLLTFAPSD